MKARTLLTTGGLVLASVVVAMIGLGSNATAQNKSNAAHLIPYYIVDAEKGLDTQVVATFAAGQAGLPHEEPARLDLSVFGEDGELLRSGTGATVCGPCSYELSVSSRRVSISLRLLIAKAGLGSTPVTGYMIATVNNDDADVNLVNFVVNSITGPLEISVFDSDPSEIEAPKTP